MTSQSPPSTTTGIPPRDYVDAWMSIRLMLFLEGASWSGRERNHAYLNLGAGRFADVSSASAADSIGDGRAVALVDWDDDGRLDMFLKNRTAPRVQFFRNQSASGGFLSVQLEGVRCNRDAIGARVWVELDGRVLTKTLHAGDGYLSQSSKRLHFGLGDADSVQRLSVAWPDGTRDVYENLGVNARYRITQGAPEPELHNSRVEPALAAVGPSPGRPATSARTRVPLVEKLPMALVNVPAFDAPERRIASLAGRPVLLNLWGTTCAACLQEFAEFRERRDELDDASLRIVTMTTDPAANHGPAREVLARFGLDADAGFVDPDFREVLEILLKEVLGRYDVVPLPTSLLLDAAGQLVAIYAGRVDLDELLRDVKLLGRMDPKSSSDTRLMDGFRAFPLKRDLRELARVFERAGRDDLARYYLRQVRRARSGGRDR